MALAVDEAIGEALQPFARRQAERGGDTCCDHGQNEQGALVSARRPAQSEHDDQVDGDHHAAQPRDRDAVGKHPVGATDPSSGRGGNQRGGKEKGGDRDGGDDMLGPAEQHAHRGDDDRHLGGDGERATEPLHALTLTYRSPAVPGVGHRKSDESGQHHLEHDRPPGQLGPHGPEQQAHESTSCVASQHDHAVGASEEATIGEGDEHVQPREGEHSGHQAGHEVCDRTRRSGGRHADGRTGGHSHEQDTEGLT